MSLVYSTATKNARLTTTVGLIGSAGELVIGTSALAGTGTGVLARVPFANPAFNVAGGAMTTNNLPRTTDALATGNAAKAEIRDGSGTVIANGLTVGLPGSGADVILNALSVSTGQTVQITVGTITHG